MRKTTILLTFFVAAAGAGNAAAAESPTDSGAALAAECTAGAASCLDYLHGFAEGFADAETRAFVRAGRGDVTFCAKLTPPSELRARYLAWAKDHPEQLRYSRAVCVADTLQAEFPCPPEAKAAP